MMASRGMGAINSSKMPKGVVKKRRDNTDFTEYAEGGEVKLPEPKNLTEENLKPYVRGMGGKSEHGSMLGGRVGASKKVGKNTEISAYLEGGGFRPKDGQFKGNITGGGVVFNQSFKSGGKVKSKVNQAGVYTKPGMRKSLFESIKSRETQGTSAGQWSARKAQLLAKQYKARGGGYK